MFWKKKIFLCYFLYVYIKDRTLDFLATIDRSPTKANLTFYLLSFNITRVVLATCSMLSDVQ